MTDTWMDVKWFYVNTKQPFQSTGFKQQSCRYDVTCQRIYFSQTTPTNCVMCAHMYHRVRAHKLYVCVLNHMKNINYIHNFLFLFKSNPADIANMFLYSRNITCSLLDFFFFGSSSSKLENGLWMLMNSAANLWNKEINVLTKMNTQSHKNKKRITTTSKTLICSSTLSTLHAWSLVRLDKY